jgi:hypothetical protein
MKSLKPIVSFLKKNKVDCSSTSLLMRRQLRACGFKFLGSGCYKSVYGHPNFPKWVVKVTKYTGDTRDCLNYKSLPKRLRKYYVRPALVKGRLVIQKKCSTKKGDGDKAFDRLQNRFKKWDLGTFDIHSSNTGMLNGKPFFFDFLHEPW